MRGLVSNIDEISNDKFINDNLIWAPEDYRQYVRNVSQPRQSKLLKNSSNEDCAMSKESSEETKMQIEDY